MKKLKKIIAVFLTVMLFASVLAGCSNQSQPAESTNGNGSEQEPSESKNDVIKIAYIGPLTGNLTLYGQTQQNSIKLAVEEVNAAGGINGAKVEVDWYDDKSDPKETVVIAGKVSDNDEYVCVFDPFPVPAAWQLPDPYRCQNPVSHLFLIQIGRI